MAIRQTIIDDKQRWEAFLSGREEANFLQSWNWGECNQNLGREVVYAGFERDGELIGIMLGVVEPARRGRYLAVAGGPIIDWSDAELVQSVVSSLKQLADEHNCVFARIRPQIEENESNRAMLAQLGLRPAQMHLEAELTSQLDITKSAEELRADMRKNTRYELKRAKKKQIKVTASQDPKDIRQFYELQLKTAERHGFIPFSYERLHEQFKVFVKDDQAVLYSAYSVNDELIAQAIIMFYGAEASYHYGASTELGRAEPGAYLIQWKAILEAQRRGCKRYNFWGVVGPDETEHRFYGVSVFKRGFRGDDVRYLHAHDLVINSLRYSKNYFVEFIRKRARKV